MQTQAIADANMASQPFTWLYTPAGRMTRQGDPLTGQLVSQFTSTDQNGHPIFMPYSSPITLGPKQASYDSYGRIASMQIPMGGTYRNFSFDGEDQVAGFDGYAPTSTWTPVPRQGTTYTSRGEVAAAAVGNHSNFAEFPSYSRKLANGVAVTGNFDARSGMATSKLPQYTAGQTYTYAYDTSGRQTHSQASVPYVGGPAIYTYDRSYDADNHLVQTIAPANTGPYDGAYYPISIPPSGTTCPYAPWTMYPPQLNYAYSVDGHVVRKTVPAATQYHWDGDELLMVTSANTIQQLVAGKLASVKEKLVWDRDWTGQQVSTHYVGSNGPGFSSWTTDSPALLRPNQLQQCYPGVHRQQQFDPVPGSDGDQADYALPSNDVMTAPNSDGWTDGIVTFQGVRTSDPNLGHWTTPDAYAGDVHDPMSQKPFMWNRNNPYEYSDPSGYAPDEQEQLGTPSAINRIVGARGYAARMAANARTALNVPSNAPKISEDNADHMFRAEIGHIPDTALNRALLQRTASDSANLTKPPETLKQGGSLETYNLKLRSGATAWAEVRVTVDASGKVNREITNGGIDK